MNYDKLIVETSKGDMSSLEELYRDLGSTVFGLALSILRSKTLAEDVLQDTFVRVKLYAGSYRPGTNGRAWILKIARNLALSAVKNKPLEEYTDAVEYMDAGAADYMESSIDALILRESLSILDHQEKQIVLLHAVKDLKHREIAEILDMPLGTVLWKYRRAIKRLSQYLKSESPSNV